MRRAAFTVDQMVELRYRAQLRQVARQVGLIVNSFPTTNAQSIQELQQALEAYALAIRPYAVKAALLMLKDSRRANDTDWLRKFRINRNGTTSDPRSTRAATLRRGVEATFGGDIGRAARFARRAGRGSAP